MSLKGRIAIRFICLFCFLQQISLLAFSQHYNCEEAMMQCIQLIDSKFSAPAYKKAANAFETIASFEKNKWLPYYYASFTNVMLGSMDSNNAVKDNYFEKGKSLIETANQLEPDNSEIIAMKAFALQMYISVAPTKRALSNNATLNNLIAKSIALNTDNPRAYYLKAAQLYYTPPILGGGKKNALHWFTISDQKYKASPNEKLLPHWGAQWVTYMIAQCSL